MERSDRTAIRFIIDQQLPPMLAERLRQAGHEAVHVREIGMSGAKDSNIWRHAAKHGYVVISKDRDFVPPSGLAAERGPLVWIRCGNVTNAALWRLLSRMLPDIVRLLSEGARVIEVID
jgi:predicted nuclease of predicted toxin-antitoxin system